MTTSTESAKNVCRVFVMGDLSIDNVIVPFPRKENPNQYEQTRCHCFRRGGGAWLVTSIVRKAAGLVNADRIKVFPDSPFDAKKALAVPESFASLKLFDKFGDKKKEGSVYRLGESMGWQHPVIPPNEPDKKSEVLRKHLSALRTHCQRGADFLVLADYGDVFRGLDFESEFAWVFQDEPQIIWLMNSPLAEGPLWERIQRDGLDRTTLVVNANALRAQSIELSFNTSAEQVIEDFRREMNHTASRLHQLVTCRFLVIHFEDGVVYWDRDKESITSVWAEYVEEIRRLHSLGKMVGSRSVLAGAIVKEYLAKWVENEEVVDLEPAVRQGVVLCERHFRNGFAEAGFEKKFDDLQSNGPRPYQTLFDVFSEQSKQYSNPAQRDELKLNDGFAIASLTCEKEDDPSKGWNRVHAELGISKGMDKKAKAERAFHCGVRIVQEGLEAVFGDLKDPKKSVFEAPYRVAVNRFGKFPTVDRFEIDKFRSIETLVDNYLRDEAWDKPLSIAVFGKPGTGKSFSVKQILQAIDPGADEKFLEINVAQCATVSDLTKAFQRTQDRAISGRSARKQVPYVFFDEFDCEFDERELGALKYFLAPMQDGKFRAGESDFSISKTVFVFAGGTSHSFEDFCNKKGFESLKGPDFVSRLRGYMDVLGPNPPAKRVKSNSGKKNSKPMLDPDCIIRRATLLRSMLELHKKKLIDSATKRANIDKAVVRAFLEIDAYEHGSRSLEAIVQMSKPFWSGTKFELSSLPHRDQLKMHVDADRFLELGRCARDGDRR